MKRILFLSALFFILAVQINGGQIPETISYQGVLTDANDKAVPDGDYSLTFKLYDVEIGGVELWSESHSVEVTKGIFNVICRKEIFFDMRIIKWYTQYILKSV